MTVTSKGNDMDDQPGRDSRGTAFAAVDAPPSLADHVRRVLREDIFAGRFAPGERLTEAMVMERTGVSRTPAREGMQLLQVEGLVKFERRRGTYIAYDLPPVEALMVYDCRLLVEPYMTARAAERATPAQLARIDSLTERFAAGVAAGAPGVDLSKIDADLHAAIYEASGSDLIVVFRAYWSKLQLQLSTRVFSRETPRQFVSEHRAILAALKAGNPEEASSRMADHIGHGKRVLEQSFAVQEDER